MDTPRFLSSQGTINNKGGCSYQVAEFEDIRCNTMPPVKTSHLAAEVAQAVGCTLEAIAGADNGDVVPHQAADFVPVVINDDLLVRWCGVAVFPLGDVGCLRCGFGEWVQANDFLKCAPSKNVGFEQGV